MCPNLVVIPTEWKDNNFQIVSAQKFPNIEVPRNHQECSTKLLKVPNTVVAISDMLSKNQKISLYVTDHKENAGYYAIKWKNIFLRFFGTNTNFSIVDRSKLDEILKEHGSEISGIMSSDKNSKALKQAGVTHMFVVDGMRRHVIPVQITGKLIDIETAKIISTDVIMD
jgi:hypothetical protein